MKRHIPLAVVCFVLPALMAGAQELRLGELVNVETPTGARIVLDPARWPTSYNEAPMLAARVSAGELPPVEQRLPDEPLVLEPLTIGTYGGSITSGFLGSTELMNRIHAMDKYVFWNVEGTEIIPSVAREFEFSEDGRVLTFRLREGMKWSDGSPFTSKETDFWWNHVYWNKELNPNTALVLQTAGGHADFEVVDEYTIRFIFKDPNWGIIQTFADPFSVVSRGMSLGDWLPGGPYHPEAYMKQFHAEFADKAELDAKVKEAGFENWTQLYVAKMAWGENLDLPNVGPWITKEVLSTGVWRLERNPYFWEVDTEGNQLPYVDEFIGDNAGDMPVMRLRLLGGDYDFQFRHLNVQILPSVLEAGAREGYHVYLDPAQIGSNMGIGFNHAYRDDPEIETWLQNADFRRAVSMALDRDVFNDIFWLGMGLPSSAAAGPGSPQYPGDEWMTKWHTLDVERANALLDSIGLSKRDSEGFRVRTDNGERLSFELLESAGAEQMEARELALEQIAENVGIEIKLNVVGGEVLRERGYGNDFQMLWYGNWGSERMWAGGQGPRTAYPGSDDSGWTTMGQGYALWWDSDGREGVEPTDPHILEADRLYKLGRGMRPGPERDEVAKQIWEIHVDQVWATGIVGKISFWPRTADQNLGNIAPGICFESHCRYPGLLRLETAFWKTPQ